MEIGEVIQQMRARHGLSQEELASIAGISSQTISRIERGRKMTRKTARMILEAFARSGDLREIEVNEYCRAAGLNEKAFANLREIAQARSRMASNLSRLSAERERRLNAIDDLFARLPSDALIALASALNDVYNAGLRDASPDKSPAEPELPVVRFSHAPQEGVAVTTYTPAGTSVRVVDAGRLVRVDASRHVK